MNILHIMKGYKPGTGGSVVRNGNMAEAYQRNPDNSFPGNRLCLINLDGNEYTPHEVTGGVDIYRVRNLPALIVKGRKIVKHSKIRIIHAHNFRFMFAAFIIKASLPFRKIDIVTEMHALYPMTAVKECLSYFLIKRSSAIIVLADAAKKYLVEKRGVKAELITVISNGIVEMKAEQPAPSPVLKKLEEKRKNYCIASYFGSFYEWQGVCFIAENIDRIMKENPALYLVMTGNGPDEGKVRKKLARSPYRSRILLHDGIEKRQLLSLYDAVDIVLIPRLKNLSTDTAVPLKAVEAMQFSKCILAADDNGLREVLNQDSARLFRSGDIDDFCHNLSELVRNRELRAELGKKAGEDSKKLFHSWDDNAVKVKEIYRRVTEQ